MDAQGTCIVRQAIVETGVLTPKLLETAGFKVKQVAASSAADLIMSKAGITVGFLILSAASMEEQPQKQIETKIAKMAASFKESFVLILEQDIPAMLQSLSSRFMGRPTIIGVPHGLDLATMAAKIMSSLISYRAASLTDEIEASCLSSSATKEALRCIPGIGHHKAAALCMLGSLQAIAASSVEDILMATDLTEIQATGVVEFFSDGLR
ncbi:g4396 [Coccomyxa viridis]|uniref:G4396 protein n=1 Tax=Coccomyxa viridis TaxID=1274662 RepID=A0ABP1FSG6_9CHLO